MDDVKPRKDLVILLSKIKSEACITQVMPLDIARRIPSISLSMLDIQDKMTWKFSQYENLPLKG